MKVQYGKYRSEHVKEMGDLVHAFSIKDVIFNPPATIVYWIDGSKTVVKCSDYDEYDPMVGICMCVTKKLYGGEDGWASQIRRFAEKGYEKLLLNKYPIRPLFKPWKVDSLSDILPDFTIEEIAKSFHDSYFKSVKPVTAFLHPAMNKYIPDESEKKRHQEQMIKEVMFGGPNNVACQRRFVILNPDEDEEKWQE